MAFFLEYFFLATRQKVSANCKVREVNISVQVRSNKLNSEYNIYIKKFFDPFDRIISCIFTLYIVIVIRFNDILMVF